MEETQSGKRYIASCTQLFRQSVIGHLPGQVACLSDDEVWSDRLSDQLIRREPKGLNCLRLVDCESDHEYQINFVYGLT